MRWRGVWSLCLGCACAATAPAQDGTGDAAPPQEAAAVLNVDDLFDRNLLPASADHAGPAACADDLCADDGCVGDSCDGTALPPRRAPFTPTPGEPFTPTEPFAPTTPQATPQATTGEFMTLASRGRAPAMIGDWFGPLGGLDQYLFQPTAAFAVRNSSDRLTVVDQAGNLHFFELPDSGSLGSDETIEGLQARGNPAAGSPLQPGTYTAVATGETENGFPVYRVVADAGFVVPSVLSAAFNQGQIKFSESGTVLPTDRVLFNYHYFNNVPLNRGGVNVHRFVPGFEKTFFDGMSSVEVRVPFSSTLNSEIDAFGMTDPSHVEFGNVRVTPKVLLSATETTAIGAGLGILIPTADDISFTALEREFLKIENESVHLVPYIGGLYTPNDRFFSQAIVQVDFDTNGSPVVVDDDIFNLTPNPAPRVAGRIQDPTFLFFDWQVGYWLRNRSGQFMQSMTGVAAVAELHWNRSLQTTDFVDTQFQGAPTDVRIGNELETIEMINLTLGMVTEFHRSTYFTVGYTVPIGGGADQAFDGEMRAFFTHRFGPATRLQRTVFGL